MWWRVRAGARDWPGARAFGPFVPPAPSLAATMTAWMTAAHSAAVPAGWAAARSVAWEARAGASAVCSAAWAAARAAWAARGAWAAGSARASCRVSSAPWVWAASKVRAECRVRTLAPPGRLPAARPTAMAAQARSSRRSPSTARAGWPDPARRPRPPRSASTRPASPSRSAAGVRFGPASATSA